MVLMFFLFFPVLGFSQQRLHVILSGGFSNYQGDLQTKYFSLDQANAAFGAGVKYDLTSHFSVRGGFMFATVGATDKKNQDLLKARNLSFETRILEGSFLLEYTLLDLSEKKLSPYVFAGAAVYHFNPYAYDTLGNKIYLQPLGTEGQGLAGYPDRKLYSRTQFAIPFGGGVKFRIADNAVISYEIGLRKLFTDYLDDLSKTYVDPFVLAQQRGMKSVEMSYRGGELKGGDPSYPADGSVRGGPKYKDWYYFTGLTLSIGINTGNGHSSGNNRRRNQNGCPTP